MNDIQIGLRANEKNGILSIQGVDMFRLIDTDWNWENISSIKSPLLKAFFMYAEELFGMNKIEEKSDEHDTPSMFSSQEEANKYYANLFDSDGWDNALERIEGNEHYSDKAELSYDIDNDSNRTRICLLTPYNKIVWDESVYRYIYDHLNLWNSRIKDEIEIYKELGNIISDVDKIISVIKMANNPVAATKMLIKEFGINTKTANTINNMILRELTALSLERCEEIVQYRKSQKAILDKLITFKKEIHL